MDKELEIRIYLQDEIPKFGQGWRKLKARIGTKWVHLECEASKKKAKIKLRLWNELLGK